MQTRRYMSKSQRACDFCRSRKSACRIIDSPPCRLCQAHQKDCTFDRPSTKRKPRRTPNSEGSSTTKTPILDTAFENDFSAWISDIDLDLNPPAGSSMFDVLPINLDTGTNHEDILLRGSAYEPFHTHATHAQRLSALTDEAETPSITSNDDPLRTLNALSAPGEDNIHVRVCGLSGDMDPYLLDRYRFEPDSHAMVFKRLAVSSISTGTDPVQFLIALRSDDGKQVEERLAREKLNAIIEPEVGARLIDLYFRFVYTQLPVIPTSSRPDVSTATAHLLAALYAVALPFSHFDDYLCIQTAYDNPPVQQLMNLALAGIQDRLHAPTIADVQSAILVLLSPPENPLLPDYCRRWSLLGNVVTMAQDLGLYYDPTHWRMTAEQIKLRKQLSWLIRYADVWLAASLGRSPLISSSDWIVPFPSLNDFGSSDSERQDVQAFCYQLEITLILARVLKDLYSVRAAQSLASDLALSLQAAREPMEDLLKWYELVDHAVKNDDAASETSPTGILRLSYHVVKMWILRAAMRPLTCPTVRHSTDRIASTASDSLEIAVQRATLSFLDFTASLDSRQTSAFWPFWAGLAWAGLGQMCTMSMLLAKDVNEAKKCKLMLDRIRQVLRLHSRSLTALRLPLLRLDSMYWKGFSNCFELDSRILGEATPG